MPVFFRLHIFYWAVLKKLKRWSKKKKKKLWEKNVNKQNLLNVWWDAREESWSWTREKNINDESVSDQLNNKSLIMSLPFAFLARTSLLSLMTSFASETKSIQNSIFTPCVPWCKTTSLERFTWLLMDLQRSKEPKVGNNTPGGQK